MLQDAEGLGDEAFGQLVDHIIGFVEQNKQAIGFSLLQIGDMEECSKRFSLTRYLLSLTIKD